MNALYGKLKKCTSTRERTHDFLGKVLEFKADGTLVVSMKDHIDDLLKSCPNSGGTSPTPASKLLFNIDEQSPLLKKQQQEVFHSCIAKGLFIAKRARPDIAMPIAVLNS